MAAPGYLACLAADGSSQEAAVAKTVLPLGFLVRCQHPEAGAAVINQTGLFQLAELR